MIAPKLVLPVFFVSALVACGTTHQAVGRDAGIPTGGPLVVERSLKLAPGEYVRPGRTGETRIHVRGQDGLTLDLRGVVLVGNEDSARLDQARGYGLLIEDCTDIHVLGGELSGYRGCIVVKNSSGVVIDGTRFPSWFGQRLRSNSAAEDPADWLRPHDNDRGEWLERYGAAISMTNCRDSIIRNCLGRRGQNGILLTRCDGTKVYDNDFSFLSGWGIALYRASANVISHNVFDYCVRGYSHGVYHRGQDSAGILMFERSSDNVVAYNSATHCGDGVFLFGGRDAVDGLAYERGETEVGGSDRNLFFENDLSCAVANGWEGTFSTENRVIQNDLSEALQHGLWGGYSTSLLVKANRIASVRGGGVSIEHGQECLILDNEFTDDDLAIELWWDEDPQFVEGPYGRHHDTASRGHWIVGNRFEDNLQDLRILESSRIALGENRFRGQDTRPRLREVRAEDEEGLDPEQLLRWLAGSTGGYPSGRLEDVGLVRFRSRDSDRLRVAEELVLPEVPGKRETSHAARGLERGGVDTIVMGEWGPWDFRSGEPRPAQFTPGGMLLDTRWEACWFQWDETTDPRADLEAWRGLARTPVHRATVPNFQSPWAGEDPARIGSERFGLVATTQVVLARPGWHRLSAVSDDGLRLSVDGDVVLENWTWHAATRDEGRFWLGVGTHTLKLEYFQIDGATALSLDLEPEDVED